MSNSQEEREVCLVCGAEQDFKVCNACAGLRDYVRDNPLGATRLLRNAVVVLGQCADSGEVVPDALEVDVWISAQSWYGDLMIGEVYLPETEVDPKEAAGW